jgi:hypothetical protein
MTLTLNKYITCSDIRAVESSMSSPSLDNFWLPITLTKYMHGH